MNRTVAKTSTKRARVDDANVCSFVFAEREKRTGFEAPPLLSEMLLFDIFSCGGGFNFIQKRENEKNERTRQAGGENAKSH